MSDKRQAILRVSRELLAEILLLPKGSKILDFSPHLFFESGDLAIKISHPNFPECKPGDSIPQVCPTYREVRSTVFCGWGELPKETGILHADGTPAVPAATPNWVGKRCSEVRLPEGLIGKLVEVRLPKGFIGKVVDSYNLAKDEFLTVKPLDSAFCYSVRPADCVLVEDRP